MGGKRKRSGGCRDVFECARVLSNVNLSEGKGREGRERVQTDTYECGGVIPSDNVSSEEEGAGLRFMYVFFNVNLSGEREVEQKERGGGGGMNLYECFPGGSGAYIVRGRK